MSSPFDLEQVDSDGAIRETAGEMGETLAHEGDTRLDFFKKAGIAGGAAVSGGALLTALVPGTALAAGKGGKLDPPPKSFGRGDVGILNYALTLEYLEAAFYNEASKTTFKADLVNEFLAAVKKDENAHVKLLKSLLGKKAVKSPKFDFGATTSDEAQFIATAYALENTGVGAYSGQAFNIKDPAVLAGALSIVTIEARHAGLIGELAKGKKGIAPNGPTDKAVGAKKTLKIVASTGFIKS